ncbi:hypothetical protein ACNI65_07530 [Roseateles sp. So40a]|uniref:hypothetical protein n=1 Tax=Roseateles sp. So40a TaxID=3400226 RepID=UPI003A89FF0B
MSPARVGRVAVLAAALGALAGAGAGWWVDPGGDGTRPALPATAAAGRPSSFAGADASWRGASPGLDAAHAAPSDLAARRTGAPRGAVGTPELQALLRAPPSALRASLKTAMRHRDQGGWLYARALARQCVLLEMTTLHEGTAGLAPVDLNQPLAQRVSAWREQLAAGCAQLQPEELREAMNVPAAASGTSATPGTLDGADPLIQLMDRPAPPGSAAARERLAAILNRADPLMLSELGPALLQREGEAFVFDGRRLAGEDERRALEAATMLLPCALGLACDERDERVWGPCVMTGDCRHATREEAVLAATDADAGLDAGPAAPDRRAAVRAWVERLREAVLARDVDRFLRPPG